MADEWRETITVWMGEGAFMGHNSSGGEVQMGMLNGKPGVSPMELILIGVAGCTGIDVVNILEKKRQNLARLEVRVRGLRAETHPKIYTDIEITYHLWGEGLETRAIEQAIQLSEEKYCSVSAMLREAAKITTQYVLHNAEKEQLSTGM